MNMESGTEEAQFPEKEYLSEIFVAVYFTSQSAICSSNISDKYLWFYNSKI
jgi:hypothetical protein